MGELTAGIPALSAPPGEFQLLRFDFINEMEDVLMARSTVMQQHVCDFVSVHQTFATSTSEQLTTVDLAAAKERVAVACESLLHARAARKEERAALEAPTHGLAEPADIGCASWLRTCALPQRACAPSLSCVRRPTSWCCRQGRGSALTEPRFGARSARSAVRVDDYRPAALLGASKEGLLFHQAPNQKKWKKRWCLIHGGYLYVCVLAGTTAHCGALYCRPVVVPAPQLAGPESALAHSARPTARVSDA